MKERSLLPSVLLLSFAFLATAQPAAAAPIPPDAFLSLTIFPEIAMAPGGERLAFLTSWDDFRRDRTEMAVWRVELSGAEAGDLRRLTWAPGRFSRLRWSPDGTKLAFLGLRPGATAPQLMVLALGGGEPAPVSAHPRGVVTFDWMPDSETLVFASPALPPRGKEASDVIVFPGPPERTLIYRRSLRSRDPPQSVAEVPHSLYDLAVSPSGNRLAYLDGPARDPAVFLDSLADHELYLLDLPAGTEDPAPAPRRLTSNAVYEQDVRWAADGESLLSLVIGDLSGTAPVYRPRQLARVKLDDGELDAFAPRFDGGLEEVQLYGGVDSGTLVTARVGSQMGIFVPGRWRMKRLDELRGEITSLAAARDGGPLAFVLTPPDAFPEVYLAPDAKEIGKAAPLTAFNEELSRIPLPAVEIVSWKNGEGEKIEGVLMRPPGDDGAAPLPLVVDLHGGPWSSRVEQLAFNSNVNFAYYPAVLASRGYLVLAPNYRGSIGRGEAFARALEGGTCSRPSVDVITGVEYLVAEGLADPDRLGVMGYSAGGLVTNCLLGRTQIFEVALSGAGIWNDLSYFGSSDNFVQTDVRYGATPWEDVETFWKESAISGAGRITTPTLVVHGAEDRRVPTSQSYELYRALRRQGVETELLIFPGEPHFFEKPSHKLEKIERELAWLERFLSP